MLACLQRQNQPVQRLTCATKIPDSPVHHQSELSSVCSCRYPSAAELDAYAQRTADSPLSIKIFPTNIRVPQHKQINRIINGLETRGYSHSFSTGHHGLLAIVNTPAATKGVLKSSEGKRSRLSPMQLAVAPYMPPSNRHSQKPYNVGLCQAPEGSNVMMATSERLAHSVIKHMSRPSNCSPAFLTATAASCSDSGFSVAGVDHSNLPYSGAVLPTQSADVARAAEHGESLGYWQHHSTQVSLCMYRTSGPPELCVPVGSTQLSFRSQSLRAGASVTGGVPERVKSSPLNCMAMHGDFLVGQFFAPLWNSVLAIPDSYNQQELPTGSFIGLGHMHTLQPPQLSLSPGKSLCQASLLSSSLQSLESLIKEIQPPCIKEQMLGRGDDAMGIARPLDHKDAHIQCGPNHPANISV